RSSSPVSQQSLPTLAVLPFADLSENGSQNYFGAGVAEDIMTELSRFRTLIVIARDSSFLHGTAPRDLSSLAGRMGVEFVVRGSIRWAKDRMRISVQLIEADDTRCIWAESYNRNTHDIFDVLDEVAKAVAFKVVGQIEETGRQQALRKRPESLAVYEQLLIANWYLREAGKDDISKAREMFRRAIDLEPTNARAHAELAFSYLTEFWSDWTPSPKAAATKALELAKEATALDDLDSRAHLYLATALFYATSNFDAASREFDRAIKLNPNDYDVFCLLSWLLALTGEVEKCIACAEQAIRLSPLTTEDCRVAQSCAAYCAQRYDDALTALQSIPEPSNEVNAFLAMCYAQLGHTAKAESAMRTFLTVTSRKRVDQPHHYRDGWRGYWAVRYPFKHQKDLEHMLEGLSKAGMPMVSR
ncbi:MAG: FlgO family outer membrane protein, partial [Kiloniellales bacterium]|nr:FlgO family outer membrane protein [Kiloniellales bacterium]